MITGVKTCGQGEGYCILGGDCTVDKEFVADSRKGHCEGLRNAFTPRAFFVCCQLSAQQNGPSSLSDGEFNYLNRKKILSSKI